MAESRLMKDGINQVALRRVADALGAVWDAFPRARFLRAAQEGLDGLELKQRVGHVIAALRAVLPADFPAQAQILQRLPTHWHPGDPGDALRGFAAWPVIDLVAVTGLGHPALALDTLRQLTSLFSAEFAIRPFLDQHWDLCAARLAGWLDHPSEHVRRLVSEGTRPRLPWGMRLAALVRDPSPTLPFLERLKDDPSEYVRRSVANHVNDIAKDHPDLAADLCTRWAEGAGPERAALVRHAARTLVKQGHRTALALHGADQAARVRIDTFAAQRPVVRVGESQTLALALTSTARTEQRLLIDFVVHFRRASGETSPKVFKWTQLDLAPGASFARDKAVSFKPITTRRHYPGEHRAELLVNGRSLAATTFVLKA